MLSLVRKGITKPALKEQTNMKLRNIGIMVAAVIMIAATGIGNAFAWTGTEASYCNSPNYALWDTQLGGSSSVPHDTQYTFGPNTFHNSYTQRLYIQLYGSDDRSGSYSLVDKGVVDPGYTATSSGGFTSGQLRATSTTGWDCVNVQHYYGITHGDTSIQVNPWGLLDLNII
jgi:hypothetical protein